MRQKSSTHLRATNPYRPTGIWSFVLVVGLLSTGLAGCNRLLGNDDDDTTAPIAQMIITPKISITQDFASPTYTQGSAITDLVLPQATTGTSNIQYSLAIRGTPNTLPGGLSFAADTRTLSGTPSGTNSYDMAYTATDNETQETETLYFSLTIVAAQAGGIIESISTDDATPYTGQSFTLTAVVHNADTTATSASITFYRSADTLIDTGDTTVASESIGSVPGEGSASISATTTAETTAGTYYYGACVILGETTNCSNSIRLVVAVASQLSLTAATTGAVVPGGSLELSATLTNQGAGSSARTTELQYYRSNDTTNTPSTGTSQGIVTVGSIAASGGTNSQSVTVTVPIEPGDYHYFACAQGANYNSNNNAACSATTSITVPDRAPTFDTSSDLYARFNGATLSYVAGTAVDEALPTATSGNGSLSHVLSGLPAGLSFNSSTPGLAGTPTTAGTTSVTYTASDADTNTAASDNAVLTFTISVEANLAPSFTTTTPEYAMFASQDLSYTVTGTQFSETLPVAMGGNSPLTYALTTASGSLVGLGLVFDASTRGLSGSLQATNGPVTLTYTVTDADDDNSAGDSASLSFTITVNTPSPTAGFAVESIMADSTARIVNQMLVLTASVRNQGSQPASSMLRFYRSTDMTIDTGDTPIGSAITLTGVATLASTDYQSSGLQIAATVATGTYYYGACVAAIIGETNLSNNCSPGTAITISASDLSATLTLNNTHSPGVTYTMEPAVINLGTLTNASTAMVHIYRSVDDNANDTASDDVLVGTAGISLNPNTGSVTSFISVALPYPAGPHYYYVCVTGNSYDNNPGNDCSAPTTLSISDSIPTFPDNLNTSLTFEAGSEQTQTLPAVDYQANGGIVYSLSTIPGFDPGYGLVFDPSNRTLSGTPTVTPVNGVNLRYRATDSNKSYVDDLYTLIVVAPPP